MRRFAMAIAIACVLSATSLAGEIPSTGAPAPPPPGITQGPGLTTTIVLTILSLVR